VTGGQSRRASCFERYSTGSSELLEMYFLKAIHSNELRPGPLEKGSPYSDDDREHGNSVSAHLRRDRQQVGRHRQKAGPLAMLSI
jgi:hypothetical protein